MDKNSTFGLIILFSMIVIALTGGMNNVSKSGFLVPANETPEQKQIRIQNEINNAERQANELKAKIQAEEDKKLQSPYFGIVDLSFVTRGTDVNSEYITLRVNGAKTPINITGWTIKSRSSGVSIAIPQASKLFFANSRNSEEDVFVNSGDTIYINTGLSPNGSSFKLNKCSGYLSQFQTFYPYIYTSCPAPKDEVKSSIPKTVNNDACLDYIDYFPSCRIQTESLPANWSYECTNFIYSKINYPSCVDTHKNDKDFYLNEWRIYLKRSERLWKDRREDIVLLDSKGLIVDTLQY